MSTLKHLVAERRAADLPPGAQSASALAPLPSLLVFKWDNHSWVLPWSYFLGAHHEAAESGERLTLSFSLCEVLVQGERLDRMLPDIAACRLESLRELPEKYRNESAPSGPSIREISIRAAVKAGELEHRPDAGLTASGA